MEEPERLTCERAKGTHLWGSQGDSPVGEPKGFTRGRAKEIRLWADQVF